MSPNRRRSTGVALPTTVPHSSSTMPPSLGLILIALLWVLCPSIADQLVVVGVLGNSGESGDTLARVGVEEFEDCASGVTIGRDLSVWYSGGDRVNCYGLDGRLIATYPLDPQGSRVDSRTFALVGGTLYFLGRLPNQQAALFALANIAGLRSAGRKATPVLTELPKRKRDWVPYCLAQRDLDGQLVILTEPQEFSDARLGAYFFDPKAKALSLAFSLPGDIPGGAAVDQERKVLYIGAHFGQFVGGQTHSDMYGITAVRPDGTPLPGSFPIACTKTPAVPTQFRGLISLAGGALWDAAWYGFLSRLDLNGAGAPGRVVQWHHELGYPTQVQAIGGAAGRDSSRLLAISTAGPDALYLARWDDALQQLQWSRRIGCLPVITSLGLSPEGWVTVGTGRSQAWWEFEDSSDTPPRKAELHIAVTPGVFRGEQFLALAAQYSLADLKRNRPVAALFSCRTGGNNEARRVTEQVPMRKPIGLSTLAPTEQGATPLFVSDADTKKVWQTQLWCPELQPDNAQWKPLPCADAAAEKLLETATDLAALSNSALLAAVDGAVLMLELGDEGCRVRWQFHSWGEGPDQRFGRHLRLCADRTRMLVADTDRHRALLFDWRERRLLAQVGVADQPGSDLRHLDLPTLVALSGTRAVIADQGNQRVVKVLVL